MPKRALQQTMHSLREELSSGEPLSPEQRRSLEALLRDLEPLVAEGDDDADPDSLAERLREVTEEFEESHPNLTLAIGAVADALARFGL